jgi:hypothetical protein
MEKIKKFLTPQDGGEEEGEEPEYGEGEEEGLQEREQRAKQRQIMKEIRAKKVRCDSPIKKILSFKTLAFWRRFQCCGSALFYADPDLGSKAQNATFYYRNQWCGSGIRDSVPF